MLFSYYMNVINILLFVITSVFLLCMFFIFYFYIVLCL